MRTLISNIDNADYFLSLPCIPHLPCMLHLPRILTADGELPLYTEFSDCGWKFQQFYLIVLSVPVSPTSDRVGLVLIFFHCQC